MAIVDSWTSARAARQVLSLADEVLRAAQAYAETPGTETLRQLTEVSEPPRQGLFRRLNRATGGTLMRTRLRPDLIVPSSACIPSFPQPLIPSTLPTTPRPAEAHRRPA